MSSFGGTVKLTGESEYQRALKQITTDLNLCYILNVLQYFTI